MKSKTAVARAFDSSVSAGLSMAMYIFPLAAAVGVLSGLGLYAGAAAGVAGCLCVCFGGVACAPSWLLFMPAFYCLKEYGSGFTLPALLLGAALWAAASALSEKKLSTALRLPPFASAGLLVGAAFLATVILTRDYFGIDAFGNTAMEMLRSYRSNGFHANWRGVLYGTITLVVMITWPRKFKRFKEYLPAPFAAVAFPLVLNMLLNYEAYRTPVYEVGSYSLAAAADALFDFSGFDVKSLALLVPAGLCFAVCFALCAALPGRVSIGKPADWGVRTAALAFLTPLEPVAVRGKTIAAGLSGAVFVCLFSCVSPLVERIPTHSLAVVLLVLGWQAVDWGSVKRSFGDGFLSAAGFILILLCFVFATPLTAFLLPAALSALCIKNRFRS